MPPLNTLHMIYFEALTVLEGTSLMSVLKFKQLIVLTLMRQSLEELNGLN